MIGGNPLNSHSFYKNKSLAAVLTAIAIPVFTTQLERSREATDMSNVRAAYAEVMADYLAQGASGTYSATVPARQQQANWQNSENGKLITRVDGVESTVTVNAAVSGSTYTITVSNNDAGKCTVSVGAA